MFRELRQRMAQRRPERRATKAERAQRKAEAKAHRLEVSRGTRGQVVGAGAALAPAIERHVVSAFGAGRHWTADARWHGDLIVDLRDRISPWYLPSRGMVRRAIALSLLTGAAGCGGSGHEPRQPVERSTSDVAGDIRSPDVRALEAGIPLVSATGRWRCATSGSIELRIGSGAEATLSSGGRTLALVSDDRALVNRECDRGRGGALPSLGTPRVADGPSLLHCESPQFVLVGFYNDDLTVRDAAGGRFLAGAAVSYDHPAVAVYWTAGCARL